MLSALQPEEPAAAEQQSPEIAEHVRQVAPYVLVPVDFVFHAQEHLRRWKKEKEVNCCS